MSTLLLLRRFRHGSFFFRQLDDLQLVAYLLSGG